MKKIVAILLAAALAVSMAACGSSASSAAAPAASSKAASSTPASSAAASSKATTDTADFNPDKEDGKSIEWVREQNGEVPVKDGATLGAVAKAFSNEFWRTLKTGYEEGAKTIAKQGVNITVKVDGPTDENDEQGQLTIVQNMINQGYDALMLSPISDSNLTPAVEEAADAKIPVFNVNDGLIASAPYFIGPNAYQNGQLAAEWISNKLGDKGDVAIVIGMPKAFAARERTAGFEDWVKNNNSGMKIVAEQNADWDRQKAKDLAATWIQQYPDLKAIFCNNDTMALGVVEAVDESGKDILVVGVDGIGEAYDSIRNGGMDATIDSFPYYMAQIALECSLRSMAGQTMPRVVWTPQALIDSTNVDTEAASIINWTDATYTAAK